MVYDVVIGSRSEHLTPPKQVHKYVQERRTLGRRPHVRTAAVATSKCLFGLPLLSGRCSSPSAASAHQHMHMNSDARLHMIKQSTQICTAVRKLSLKHHTSSSQCQFTFWL